MGDRSTPGDDVPGIVESEWRGFSAEIMHPEATESQWREMRRAFFGGAAAMHFYRLGLSGDSPRVVGEALSAIDAELERAFADIEAGKD